MKYNEEAIEKSTKAVIEMFTAKEFPAELRRTIIRRLDSDQSRPSDKWSLRNQMIMRLIGRTEDARGFDQWKQVERSVKKGERAFHIYGPILKKYEEEDEAGETKEKVKVVGYTMIPVFAVHQTEGKELPVVDYTPKKLPKLFDIAEKFGLSVKYKPMWGSSLGVARADGSIELNSEDADVFFHELAHQVNAMVESDFWQKPSPERDRAEICAELAAAILCQMYGYEGYIKQSYEYIQNFSGTDVMKEVGSVLDTVNAIVTKIVEKAGE